MTLYSFTSVKQTDELKEKKKGMQRGSPISVVKGSDVISSKLKLMYVGSAIYLL